MTEEKMRKHAQRLLATCTEEMKANEASDYEPVISVRASTLASLCRAALSTKQEAGEVERARRSYSIGFEEAKGDAANKVSAMARDFKNHGSIDRLEPFTEIALAIRAIPCPETATQEAGEVSRSQTAQALEEAAAKIKALGDHIDPTTNDKWDHGYLTAITGALDAIRALSLPAPDGSSAAAAAPFEQDTQKAAASTLVFCVRCIDGDGDVVHIFSSKATLQTFLDADQRSHVIYDYVIDCPERTEQVKQ